MVDRGEQEELCTPSWQLRQPCSTGSRAACLFWLLEHHRMHPEPHWPHEHILENLLSVFSPAKTPQQPQASSLQEPLLAGALALHPQEFLTLIRGKAKNPSPTQNQSDSEGEAAVTPAQDTQAVEGGREQVRDRRRCRNTDTEVLGRETGGAFLA